VNKSNDAEELHPQQTVQEQRRLSTTVSLKEVAEAEMRFEASAHNIEARRALAELRQSGLELRPLFGADKALATAAPKPTRFARNYVSSERGIAFISSSEINALKPRSENYISKKLTHRIEALSIEKWDVLISRSGTIGNIGFAGANLEGYLLSEHAIRVRFDDPNVAGFVAAYLRTEYGRLLLRMGSYGSVVTHIEPEHLARVPVPWLHPIQVSDIGRKFVEAAELRDEANESLDQAETLLLSRLGLPSLKELIQRVSSTSTKTIKASTLVERFEASYHDPLAYAIEGALEDNSHEIVRLDDPRLVKEVRPITKFRKRTYVEKGGIPLLSSKQLFQIDPIDIKLLAKGAHTKDLDEIALEPNMLAVTCSGTIGRVQIIPTYMKGWTANQHATRIIASKDQEAGFLYTWLASEFGNRLIRRHSYGSVILEIDKEMLSSVSVPLLPEEQRHEIGNLVLRANKLRDEAWKLEKDAITRIEQIVKPKKKEVGDTHDGGVVSGETTRS
jgi:type I restriction enzyme S subunit